MKRIIAILALICIAAAKQQFEVRCPNCLVQQVRDAKDVTVIGGVATNMNGVQGVYQHRTASFKCSNCRKKFNSPVQPDQFVPIMPAIPVRGTSMSAPPPPASPTAKETLELARQLKGGIPVNQPDLSWTVPVKMEWKKSSIAVSNLVMTVIIDRKRHVFVMDQKVVEDKSIPYRDK